LQGRFAVYALTSTQFSKAWLFQPGFFLFWDLQKIIQRNIAARLRLSPAGDGENLPAKRRAGAEITEIGFCRQRRLNGRWSCFVKSDRID